MRTVVAIVCALALAGAFVPAVSAGQPERESAKGTTAFYDFPAGTVCPFEATLDFYKSEGTYFTFDNGVFKIAYTFWIRFTNVDTGNTRILHEAGNVVTTPMSSDITATRTDGRELSAFRPEFLVPELPERSSSLSGARWRSTRRPDQIQTRSSGIRRCRFRC